MFLVLQKIIKNNVLDREFNVGFCKSVLLKHLKLGLFSVYSINKNFLKKYFVKSRFFN